MLPLKLQQRSIYLLYFFKLLFLFSHLFLYFYLFRTFEVGPAVDDQQVGCLWQGEHLVSLSLSSDFNYFDRNSPSKPIRVIKVFFFFFFKQFFFPKNKK